MKISTEFGSKTETKKEKTKWKFWKWKAIEWTWQERVNDLKSININYLREKKKAYRGNEQSFKGLLGGI